MTANNPFFDVPAAALPAQYQNLLAIIHIFDEAIHYTRLENGKAVAGHQVDPADLASAMAGVPITSGLLPRDCLFYARHSDREWIGIYLPPVVRTLRVSAGKRPRIYKVPTPPLVFLGYARNYAVLAVKQRPGVDDRLYQAPFPNVNTGGPICRGNVAFPECTARTIHQAAALFFESQFNDHLADGKSKSRESVLGLWHELHKAGAEEYPLDDLMATRATLKDLIGGDLR